MVDSKFQLFQELLALGEVVGTESRGLSTDTIAGLPSLNYKVGSDQHGSNDSYVQILLLVNLTLLMISGCLIVVTLFQVRHLPGGL